MKENPNEKLRELACYGDWEAIEKLLKNEEIDINSQNKMNGWTALHWAAKRKHIKVVKVKKKIIKLGLQSSYIAQNSFHFADFYRFAYFSDVNGQWC